MQELRECEQKLFELISISATIQGCSKFFENCGRLTSAEEKFLSVIGEKGNITISELAVSLNMTKSAASQFIDKLIIKKYVERRPDILDRRKAHVSLTQLGIEVFEKGKNCKNDLIQCFRKEVGHNDKNFLEVMEVIIKCLKNHYRDIS